mgnify:CR=1 FL=1|jgi:hypothetical protein
MNVIPPVDGTTNIRIADFVRLNDGVATYLFSTAASAITVSAVDPTPFTALSQLLKIGEVQRDIKSTANETTLTLTGVDPAMIGLVLSTTIKGSKVEMWHGFFNQDGELLTTGGTGGLYKFFTGYVTGFQINEDWSEDARMYVATISLQASPIQLILQNRNAGRYTNNNAWQYFNSGDTSMNRVSFIETISYPFGRT